MALQWFQVLIFPGFVFVFVLALLLEQINSRVYRRFSFGEGKTPMFIPIFEHFKLVLKGKPKKLKFKSILQGILLVIMVALALFGVLLLPINNWGIFPNLTGGYEGYRTTDSGITGIISFEGDVLLLFGIMFLFGFLAFLVQLLSQDKTAKESFSSLIRFVVLDIPFLFALAGPILAKKSLSLSLIAHDIRIIIDANKAFGFVLLLPLSAFIAIYSLALKFDQPYFDRINTEPKLGERPPTPKNWRLHVWHVSMRIMETVLAGLIVTICFGGPHLPIPIPEGITILRILGHTTNFIIKCALVFILTTLIKCIRPRMRLNQTLNLSFKILTPISLVSVLLVGGYIAIWGIA